MNCFYCNNEMENKKIVDKTTVDGKTFIIKNTPVLYCGECMEYFYDATISNNIEKMITISKNYKTDSEIVIVDYEKMIKTLNEISAATDEISVAVI